MKKTFFYLTGIFLVILGCSKCKEEVNPYAGDIENLEMNGRPWKRFDGWKAEVYAGSAISAFACYPKDNPDSLFQFSIYYDTQDHYNREALIISDLKPRIGVQKIFKKRQDINGCPPFDVPSAGFYLSAEDGDVSVGDYDIFEKADNFINITSFDKKTNEMRGTFDVTFTVSSRLAYLKDSYPDTLRFHNGQFKTIFVRTR